MSEKKFAENYQTVCLKGSRKGKMVGRNLQVGGPRCGRGGLWGLEPSAQLGLP